MAAMSVRVNDLANAAGGQLKALRTLINGNLADLSTLNTTAKNNLVAAINEIDAELQAIAASGGATINDSATASTTQTYSITKIVTYVSDAIASAKDDILGGAGEAYDTLQELKLLLDSTDGDLSALTIAIGKRVSTEASQGLTTQEKQNARDNIDVYSKSEIGTPDTDFVATLNTAMAS